MTNPIGRFHNVETGEIVDRELTDQEFEELTNPKPFVAPWESNE